MPRPEAGSVVPSSGAPDRVSTVGRHTVRLRHLDPLAPLQVGNGAFAFAVDPTGLQTFPDAYPVAGGGSLLGTLAEWGWHSVPPREPYDLAETRRVYATPRGLVPYVDLRDDDHDAASQTPAERWLRGNPHKLQLATIGLWTGQASIDIGNLADVDQQLDLWTGIITSRFRLAGERYTTRTAAHPEGDAVALDIVGPADRPVGVRLRFPYGSEGWADASDWTKPEAHASTVNQTAAGWTIERRLDDTSYTVTVRGEGLSLRRLGEHDLVFAADGRVKLAVAFEQRTPASAAVLHADEVMAANLRAWPRFWSSGACIDLSNSSDPRAGELERRLVLSQYLTAVNGAGSHPPAEAGLLLNAWRGKFHLEMHPFHAMHFAAWGRPWLLERSLGWYGRALAAARETAERQGYAGARWPKQVGPDGRETPSSIGPFLVWQQPHLIYMLEMLYRADPSVRLESYAELVHATAEFMVSFAVKDEKANESEAWFHLGPPVVPAQESYASTRASARDPTFELAYWSWALATASRLWERLGRTPPPRWRTVSRAMERPHVLGGAYSALATPPFVLRDDHPSMLAALGLVPPTDLIDPVVMARTFDRVLRDWDWGSTWGWDFPVAAMTATRLGRPSDAVDALLLDRPKNRYLVNGHNRQSDRLPAYLPGNGALLLATALMAGGWDGSGPTPGFGRGWQVAHEGLIRMP